MKKIIINKEINKKNIFNYLFFKFTYLSLMDKNLNKKLFLDEYIYV